MVGDPSGKTPLAHRLAVKTCFAMRETYKEQIYKILDPQKQKSYSTLNGWVNWVLKG